MDHTTANLVPKVHPLTRAAEPEDPFVLNATSVAGDPDLMIRAVVQEYAWMGWSAEQIIELFQDPFFPVLNQLWRALGEAELRARIASCIERFGVFRFRSTLVEPAAEEAGELEDVLQIGADGGAEDVIPPGGLAPSSGAWRPRHDPSFVSVEALTRGRRKPEGGCHE